jgi:1,4-dihydroxy-2-naphthoate octaprenyltransferase
MNLSYKDDPMMQPQIQFQTNRADVWWRLTRPHTLTASFVPVFIGSAMAAYEGAFHFPLFFAMLTASMLIQAATNMFNEYYDYVRGLDTTESVGIGGTIVRDGVKPKVVRNLAFAAYGAAMLLGVYICSSSSWWIALIGLVCMAVGYLYTGGPLPISSTPLGELFSGFFMGPVIILITCYIQTGSVTMANLYISLSVGILIGAINMANNIRDLEGDKEHGRKTLPILLGRPRAVALLSAMFAAAFLWIALLVIQQIVTPWALLVLLSVPKAVQAAKQFRGKTKPLEMMPAMKATAQLNTLFGLLLTIGLIIETWTGGTI